MGNLSLAKHSLGVMGRKIFFGLPHPLLLVEDFALNTSI